MAEQKSPFARGQGQSQPAQKSPFARNAAPAPKPKAVAPPARRGTKRDATTEVAQFINEVSRSLPLVDELQAAAEVGRLKLKEAGEGRGGYGLFKNGKMGPAFSSTEQQWTQARAQQNSMSRDLNTRRPNTAGFARGTGGVLPALAALGTGGATAAPQAAQTAATLGSRLLPYAQAATAAAASGAVTRATDQGTLRQRLVVAADPGSIAMDAALGAGITAGGQVTGAVVNKFRTRKTPQQRAATVVSNTNAKPVSSAQFQRGEMPFEQAGPKGVTLARAVASVPGQGQEIANTALRARAQAAPARMNAAVSNNLGNGRAYYSTIDDLMTKRKTEAAPLYDEAYKVGVFLDDFNAQIAPILDTPAGRQAMKNAVEIAKNERVPINNIGITIDDNAGTVKFDTIPNMQTLDYVRRGFDDVVEASRNDLTGKMNANNATRAVIGLRSDLNDALVTLNPKYGEALDAWSGPSKVMDAMRRGRKMSAGRIDPEEFGSSVGRMTDAEREGMRIGVARTVSDRLRGRNPQSEIRAITSDLNYQDRLREAFPDQKAFDSFLNQANTEASFQGNMNQVLNGSRTTPLREDIDAINAQLDGDGMGGQILSALEQRAGGTSFTRQAISAAINKVATSVGNRGLNDPEVSRILGEALFTDPRLFNQLLVEQAKMLRISPEQLTRLVIASATAAPVTLRQPNQGPIASPY